MPASLTFPLHCVAACKLLLPELAAAHGVAPVSCTQVTNALQNLPEADNILWMVNGEIKAQGKYDHLVEQGKCEVVRAPTQSTRVQCCSEDMVAHAGGE